MAHAITSAIPPTKAGVGAGINGTLVEFGDGLGAAVLGAVLTSRVAVLIPVAATSLPGASAGSAAERRRVPDARSSGMTDSHTVKAVAVLLGGLVAAALLRRAERADSEVVAAAWGQCRTAAKGGGRCPPGHSIGRRGHRAAADPCATGRAGVRSLAGYPLPAFRPGAGHLAS
ncbi:hypothetical protein BIV24_14800 [Streptomyces colonosanans]|uniref:Major facilitator superfamily (MFS) profile domain-containing protein n=1 Tax=Streptomyces colonosanans TaxID=1428652 RepID=A0A1S2PEJ5_9ACTN|nr:hypothetical protein BIV24_14800 [Streptomyces colonosanans]